MQPTHDNKKHDSRKKKPETITERLDRIIDASLELRRGPGRMIHRPENCGLARIVVEVSESSL